VHILANRPLWSPYNPELQRAPTPSLIWGEKASRQSFFWPKQNKQSALSFKKPPQKKAFSTRGESAAKGGHRAIKEALLSPIQKGGVTTSTRTEASAFPSRPLLNHLREETPRRGERKIHRTKDEIPADRGEKDTCYP